MRCARLRLAAVRAAEPELMNTARPASDSRSNPLKQRIRCQLAVKFTSIDSRQISPAEGGFGFWASADCDAFGVYSDAMDPSFDTRGRKFLRGYQTTDQAGIVNFVTIYPGWYPGRTIHIHFKIRTNPNAGQGTQFTSQLYFDDAYTDQVFNEAPYDTRGNRTTRNGMDAIFLQGGAELILAVTKVGPIYQARFNIGLNV